MFERHKPMYMTRAISEELSKEHQQFIFQYLREQQNQLTDYLQVFEFYIENNQQFLRQEQEVPHREAAIFVTLEECRPIWRTVWAMDQHDHIILLFPSDY
ncbi:DUF960 family protein [Priestia flexa]|uniref:DUF960 family protein n=1 Tax=Priestia flexa TaxID=86664 RepID=UPI001C958EA4|nr:DUF960 family protein [Priestia flexa]MBY6088504.1 DUF960 domain-containing protein [Priestia flexa]